MSRPALPVLAPAPIVMRTSGWKDYALIDSGGGRKLERYGPFRVVRPEPQCLWSPRLPTEDWEAADAVFDPSDEDEAGRWRFKAQPKDTWPLAWRRVRFKGRFTAFRHLAFFPEQAANWAWLDQALRAAATQLGLKAGPMFQPIRVAICGRKNAPPLFETMAVLGRETCLTRVRQAEERLQLLDEQTRL